MTSTGKIVVGAVVVILIAAGAYYWFTHNSSGTPGTIATSTASQNAASSSADLPTSPSDTSDAAVNQDVTSIDTQMNGLQSDNADVNSSLNAQ